MLFDSEVQQARQPFFQTAIVQFCQCQTNSSLSLLFLTNRSGTQCVFKNLIFNQFCLVTPLEARERKTNTLKDIISRSPQMINCLSHCLMDYVNFYKRRGKAFSSSNQSFKITFQSTRTLTDAGSDYPTLCSLTLAPSTSQIPGPRTVVRAAFRCLFVTDGCAHAHRCQCSKRRGRPGCVNQSRRGVEMYFYPATDLEHSPLLKWTQVG